MNILSLAFYKAVSGRAQNNSGQEDQVFINFPFQRNFSRPQELCPSFRSALAPSQGCDHVNKPAPGFLPQKCTRTLKPNSGQFRLSLSKTAWRKNPHIKLNLQTNSILNFESHYKPTGRHLKIFSLPAKWGKFKFCHLNQRCQHVWIANTYGPSDTPSVLRNKPTQSSQPFLQRRNFSVIKGDSHCSVPWVELRFSIPGPLGEEILLAHTPLTCYDFQPDTFIPENQKATFTINLT